MSSDSVPWRRQSSQIGGNGGGGSPGLNSVDGPAPPPPPMLGNISSQKLAAEIAPMKKSYEPPAAIQNAMMTKDKKPFTYTPGGLDLAEIRSPRMAKRISRNAHMEDSCTPQQQRVQPTGPPHQLPPSALAAMQPQIAIPVFPPGGGFPSQGTPPPPPPPPVQLNTTAAYTEANFPPPPPPLPFAVSAPGSPSAGAVPPPPPPPPLAGLPTSPIPTSLPQGESKSTQQNGFAVGQPLAFLQDIQNRPQLRSVGPVNQNKLPADFVAEIPVHAPLKPVNHPPRSSYDPSSNSTQIPVNLKPTGPKPTPVPNSAPPFIPQPMSPEPAPLKVQPERESSQTSTQQIQITAPTVVQNPIRSVVPPSPGPGSPVPVTSNLNKAPAPWMTSRQTSRDAAPWTSKPPQEDLNQQQKPVPVQQTIQPPQQQPAAHGGSSLMTRVIPIQIEGREPPAPPPAPTPAPLPKLQQPQPYQPPYFANAPQIYMTPQQQQYLQQQQQQFMQQPVYANQQQQQQQQQSSSPQPYNNQVPPPQSQSKTRIIPIQIEGDLGSNQQQAQGQSPVGFSQRSNSIDGTDAPRRPLQSQTSWTGNPTQSRSFRVLQKITGSEEEAAGPFPAAPSETFLVNRVVPPQQAASPVGADNSKCWNPNTPPPLYPNPNYWYYPPQSPEEQQQFWEHYNAMCAYMAQMNAAAYRYSPYPMYPYPYLYPSDNEEYSGYSSSDEMTYHGQMFKKQAEMALAAKQVHAATELTQTGTNKNMNINRDSSQSSVNSEETEKGDTADDTSGTDTEVEDDDAKMNSLRSIKSVPNINVYNDSDTQTEESEESEEECEGKSEEEGDIPHQLSIIFEESEHSDVEGSKKFPISREQSQSNDSCATLQSDEGDDNDNSTDSTVTVRLPLQFKFSRSSNDEEVATVIVGNSEVESGRATPVSAPENLIITEIFREDSDPDVTATICLKQFKKRPEQPDVQDHLEKINYNVTPPPLDDSNSTSDSPVDFWKDIPDKESYMSKQNLRAYNETPSQTSEDDSKHDDSDYHSSSTSIQTVKKGFSGSENLSGSETETAYSVNATKHTDTDNNGPCNENELDEEDNNEPEEQIKEEEEDYEEQEDKDQVEEEGGDEEEGEEEEETNNVNIKDFRNRQPVTSDSESSEEESDESEDEQEPQMDKNRSGTVDQDEVSVTTKVPNIRKEQSVSDKKKITEEEEEEDDSEEEDESEDSERVSSRTSSSEEEEEEDEDEDIIEQKQSKPVMKKEIQRPPAKLEKHRSQEESEEDDSGVTSDLSRHISETDTDPECGGELRKMTRYQRAATHSRLFKLLQEECNVDESPEEEPVALSARKERLSLPLQNQFSVEQDSLSSSSGINSPSSPTTTDKLVKELVKSLLSRKKGRHFRKLPLEKLHAAALRILQDDMDPYDTASTSDDSNNLLSPVASSSSHAPTDPTSQGGLTNPESYGGNYYDYCRYYSTWGNPENYGAGYDMPDEYEILPSKAFRILQENTLPERYSSPIPRIAVPVRCPRVSHPPLQTPHPPPESNANSSIPESTSTSQET